MLPLVAFVALPTAGCGLVLGLDRFTDESGGSGAPQGWSGPVVLVSTTSSDAPPCPATAPHTEFTTHSGLSAPAAICGCACDQPAASQLSCGDVTLTSAGDCFSTGMTLGTVGVKAGDCVALSSLPTFGVWLTSASTFSATGTCTPHPEVDVTPVQWAATHRACGFTDSTPPPLGSDEQLCVYTDGEATCPAEFPDALDTAEDAPDTRGCSKCTCGDISGSCTGNVTIQSDGCVGFQPALVTLPVGQCGPPQDPGGSDYTLRADVMMAASCPPSGVASVGEAKPTNVRTICCAKR